ncbi:hypothetical protein POTOM_061789 [Populus tomentosa]|uniref:GAG-pre-integrase domain-containing protein n=1 Tax=Populus tomentosa TaxID=118781 RepID=A0A8X7XRY4_POPTO|nr:hypothetical protein POTOM_061789 [Populus tomentosa]
MQLMLGLQSTKKGSLSMINYIMKVKGATNNLAAIGESVLEQDQVMNLLGGLGDYNAVVIAINIRDDKIFIEAVHSMLLHLSIVLSNKAQLILSIYLLVMPLPLITEVVEESTMATEDKAIPQIPATTPTEVVVFDISYQTSQNNGTSSLNARNHNIMPTMVASSYNFASIDWYLDSGASHHLTQNERNLNNSTPYTGADRVTVGNANLISVAKFCSDNNALIEFRSNSFIVKDLHTKKVLVQGRLENGFYKFLVLHKNNKLAYVGVHNTSTFHSHRLSPVHNKVELWHHQLGHVALTL